MSLLHRNLVRERLQGFLEKASPSGRVLDLGCGNSRYSALVGERVGFDRVFGIGVAVVGDAHALPFRPGVFDAVLSTEVLEHLTHPRESIAEVQRVLRSGGTLVLTTRFLFPVHESPWDHFRFTRFALEDLLAAWEDVEVLEEAGPFSTIAILLQRIAWQADLVGGRWSRAILLAVAQLTARCDWIARRTYGDRRRTTDVAAFTSGYHVRARRP
ncbi:MAG: methyltransferase domain-containing protein [Acidobacteria bacterium]|nr:MAG: methyltransferase domain-containing protein [Acidobacteriota bacterium]REK04365.1 MAG: methyltransferase domain-containing protein [Acidobacteriota bacterium]